MELRGETYIFLKILNCYCIANSYMPFEAEHQISCTVVANEIVLCFETYHFPLVVSSETKQYSDCKRVMVFVSSNLCFSLAVHVVSIDPVGSHPKISL